MLRGVLFGATLCRGQEQAAVFDGDEQALLQGKSMRHTPLATEDKHSTLLSTARHLALTLKEQSPDTIAALVASIDATIQAMKPLLVAEHEAAQSLLDAQVNEMTACGEVSSYATDVTAFEAMVLCRSDVATATTEKNDACQLWLGERAILTEQDTYPGCLSDSPPTADQFLEHVEAWSTFAAAELVDLRTKKTTCESKTTTLTQEEDRCSEEETEYDDAFCSRRSSCTLLHACHDHEVLGYTTLVTTLQAAEAARQAQFRSISQVECLLGLVSTAVAGNSTIGETDLDTCDGNANADHLVLQNPDPNANSVDSTPSLAACPSTTAEDPECGEITVPQIWTAGAGIEDDSGSSRPPPNLALCPSGTDITGEWTVVLGQGSGIPDLGSECFNELFQHCPVVKYTTSTYGDEESIYVRKGNPYPGDAYALFKTSWNNPDNEFHTDFDIYDTLEDARADTDPWQFCNFYHTVGYPRDCGKTAKQTGRWYPSCGGSPCFFEIYTGSDCPSAAIPAPPPPPGHFLMEFCQGPRTGEQFTVTIPVDQMTYLPQFGTPNDPNRYGKSLCTTGDFNGRTAIAWRGDGGDHITNVDRASPDCGYADGSGMGFKIGECNKEFAGWVNGKYINTGTGCDWCRAIPAAMTALGGTGWEVFATVGEDESYKFVSTFALSPLAPAPPPPPPPATGKSFLLEFCQGARTGEQFTVTIPMDQMTHLPEFGNHAGHARWGSTYCTTGDFAGHKAIAWHGDPEFGSDPDGGNRIAWVDRASEDCGYGNGSGMGLYIGQCAKEFAGWVNGKYINSETGCDWCRSIPAAMTALGGTGWEIFATMSDDESYKFLDTPALM